ncbi:hypothetical protein M407DRAFT_139253 [Tulasnella calospora MUT 4182]|uniref:Uncharacterized protein n=1 Tax=Tulasnella calospora MUT 4182 TaxID=1051891 RepID=A0A0C3QRB6_9AGAM|nr:hypothetical protein M407DRAFT_139253 [Tulasnella calospora MUT 4182]
MYDGYSEIHHIDAELPEEHLVHLHIQCPQLESIIDPFGTMWAYPPTANHQQSLGWQKIGRISRTPKIPLSDIPSPGTAQKLLSPGTWTLWQ